MDRVYKGPVNPQLSAHDLSAEAQRTLGYFGGMVSLYS